MTSLTCSARAKISSSRETTAGVPHTGIWLARGLARKPYVFQALEAYGARDDLIS